MKKPRTLIFSGYGFNCEEELGFAFDQAGASSHIVHINDVIDAPEMLKQYQILAFPGGFAYGDDTGSGAAYASKVKNHLWKYIDRFVHGDGLVIGICNGFQVLVNLGLLPAIRGAYGVRQVALLPNESTRYTVRWTDVKNESTSPWLLGVDRLMLPIAHGEGKMYMNAKTLAYIKKHKMVALRYVQGEICDYQKLPANPTGTIDDIAGITDSSGRVFGLMPHPERAILFTQLPHWTKLKEDYVRIGRPLPVEGPGMVIFKNAVKYFS
jgi:phosphoribosylformylglycinamidine synthase subunit PurQ / glutaminase